MLFLACVRLILNLRFQKREERFCLDQRDVELGTVFIQKGIKRVSAFDTVWVGPYEVVSIGDKGTS